MKAHISDISDSFPCEFGTHGINFILHSHRGYSGDNYTNFYHFKQFIYIFKDFSIIRGIKGQNDRIFIHFSTFKI